MLVVDKPDQREATSKQESVELLVLHVHTDIRNPLNDGF